MPLTQTSSIGVLRSVAFFVFKFTDRIKASRMLRLY